MEGYCRIGRYANTFTPTKTVSCNTYMYMVFENISSSYDFKYMEGSLKNSSQCLKEEGSRYNRMYKEIDDGSPRCSRSVVQSVMMIIILQTLLFV
ncbi:Uncharacterised protein g7875 [Pycnogonum litorale]